MNRLIFFIVLIGALSAFWFFGLNGNNDVPAANVAINSGATSDGGSASVSAPVVDPALNQDMTADAVYDQRPATAVYNSADEALAAIKTAASKEYDDEVTQRFVNLGSCAWCDKFYASVRDMIVDPTTTAEQKSYYAELLAISGSIDNVKFLVSAAGSAPSTDDKEILIEALEYSTGGDQLVNYLSEQTNFPDPVVRESIFAAITNQGTLSAIEVLYKNMVDNKDTDGFYTVGTGLGELVPQDDGIPRLQEMVQKFDEYSKHPTKALFNSGLSGVRAAFDTLATAKDDAAIARILDEDTIAHIPPDDEVKDYLTSLKDKVSSAAIKDAVNKVLENWRQEEAELAAENLTIEEEE